MSSTVGHFDRNQPHDGRGRSTLEEEVDAEPRDTFEVSRKVHVAILVEFRTHLRVFQELIHESLTVLGRQRVGQSNGLELTMHAQPRRAPGLDVKVLRALKNHFVEQISKIHVLTICVAKKSSLVRFQERSHSFYLGFSGAKI